MTILIYSDEGVSAFTLAETLRTFRALSNEVKVVNHQTLNETDWEKEAKLLVIPGGRDIPYDRNLRGKGTAKIRRFVEEGGSYLGICAGAYFGCSEVIFEKGKPLEVHEKRDLEFFPGAAVGTLYDRPFCYVTNKGLVPSEIAFEGKTLYLYYNGGCTFKNASSHPSVTVLAEYKDADHQSAIIHCKVGKGNVILSGVHFEVCPKSLKQEGGDPMIAKKLETSDHDRKALITTLLSYLL
ncbi:MAG: hypothetical protein H7A38_04130 [Chlamydiales bacterium]|nr:hypothetical protein [Chlamydiales bacterium]